MLCSPDAMHKAKRNGRSNTRADPGAAEDGRLLDQRRV
jgi:hypothetical protein